MNDVGQLSPQVSSETRARTCSLAPKDRERSKTGIWKSQRKEEMLLRGADQSRSGKEKVR